MTAFAVVEAVPGAQGYAAQAEALVAQYEGVRYLPRGVQAFLPLDPVDFGRNI